ncbi:hypothetical protein HFO56_33960 [Rhizobium laguerreae]|uniref:hypothetical protein n=1 Tax=Rhizobium laguerreae TaxID=1076926 RepID=UPI001C9237CB|nr:hypothetical protein [Rhizobium laguerreae]MBY3157333.1 hypothetical protein [Rhizobium laguerreae]
MHTQKEIGDIIRHEIERFGEDAWFINNGWCHGFAVSLARRLGPDAHIVDSLTRYRNGTFPGHWWVEYCGLHFDAETPEGVSDPRQMQYHRRMRAIADSPEGQDEDDAVREALGHDPVFYGRPAKVQRRSNGGATAEYGPVTHPSARG